MKKKGSHVGFVISFSIFMIFVVFVYMILNSETKYYDDKKSLLNIAKVNFLEKIKSNLVVVTLVENGVDCIQFDASAFSGYSYFNAKCNGSYVQASKSGNNLLVNCSGIAKVYFSKESLDNEVFSSSGCINSEIKKIENKSEIFKSKISGISGSPLESLKDEIGISNDVGFSFIFTDEQGTKIEYHSKEIIGKVYAEDIPLVYVDKDGILKKGNLNLRIW